MLFTARCGLWYVSPHPSVSGDNSGHESLGPVDGRRTNSIYRRRRRRASGRLHELVPADDWCFLKGHYDGRTMTTAGVLPFPADRTSSHTTPREELGKHLGKDHGVLGLLLSPLVIQA